MTAQGTLVKHKIILTYSMHDSSVYKKMNRVFLYGLILTEKGASILEESSFIKEATLTSCQVRVIHGQYLAISFDGSSAINGQVYDVTDSTLERIDAFESVPHLFRRVQVQLDGEYVWAYVWNKELKQQWQNAQSLILLSLGLYCYHIVRAIDSIS
jgi:gamma-glutamylcyclotransferase (GGCT)/AIG2-like uncharacterized protein YtfP